MEVREPWVAGSFYPADPQICRQEAESFLVEPSETAVPPGPLHGGIVPHAGWKFSGPITGRVAACLRSRATFDSLVITGTVHVRGVLFPATLAQGLWRTPLGDWPIDSDFVSCLLQRGAAQDNLAAHLHEHSLEVPLPVLACAFPGVRLVPLTVPSVVSGVETGYAIAEAARELGRRILLVASSDLTHYGPAYHFTPYGVGAAALQWVKQENDAAMLQAIRRLDAEGLVPLARVRRNACGPAAMACVFSAARALGAVQAHILDYKTSYDVKPRNEPENFVGYVGAVF